VNIAGIRAIACRLSDQTRAAAEGEGKTAMSLSRFRLPWTDNSTITIQGEKREEDHRATIPS